MPKIIPIKDLKNTAEISELCNNSNEPIYITKNGYGDMVIMSIKTYEQMQKTNLVYQGAKIPEQKVAEDIVSYGVETPHNTDKRNELNKASQAVEVRTNLRFKKIITYQELTAILKQQAPYVKSKHLKYLVAFFEECYPSLIKKFMNEQNISREQIIDTFKRLPEVLGETEKFREALYAGQF